MTDYIVYKTLYFMSDYVASLDNLLFSLYFVIYICEEANL